MTDLEIPINYLRNHYIIIVPKAFFTIAKINLRFSGTENAEIKMRIWFNALSLSKFHIITLTFHIITSLSLSLEIYAMGYLQFMDAFINMARKCVNKK